MNTYFIKEKIMKKTLLIISTLAVAGLILYDDYQDYLYRQRVNRYVNETKVRNYLVRTGF